ncbi:hypothetical protein [Hymenobacter metallicola]|uniref:Uncharacterized protein n=1 Tax=Hymenobacter metallicola TaxID=2563114 RepID=A0A4Z0QDX1_9BACT|nr:hypothetical protein [Hymenobacter metallicola]TGE27915.1 hypothetical protein E5K02_00170 [Hymenobacter metallicola]
MRATAIVIVLGLLPQVALAQIFNKYKPGSYILADNRQARHSGQLLLAGDKLLVKNPDGKKMRYEPLDVYSFQIEGQKYTVASGFSIGSGLQSDYRGRSFVALLDSGQVLLMRYNYVLGATRVNSNGTVDGPGPEQHVYLVRGAQSYSSPTVISSRGSAKDQAALKAVLSSYVAARPDLAKLLAEDKVFVGNLRAFIHALNTNQPFR